MKYTEGSFVNSVTNTYRKFYGAEVTFIGKFLQETPGKPPYWLENIILELVNNSPAARIIEDKVFAENTDTTESLVATIDRNSEIAQRNPHRINVISGKNFVLIEDDVEQEDLLNSMQAINTALQSTVPGKTTKTHRVGGVGIFAIKKYLLPYNGRLRYKAVGRRIVAIATWKMVG